MSETDWIGGNMNFDDFMSSLTVEQLKFLYFLLGDFLEDQNGICSDNVKNFRDLIETEMGYKGVYFK